MPLWEQVKGNLVEWYSAAADKTEELAKIGVRRYDKFGISREIERQFTELGGLIYAVVIYGLALNWRWLACIAFLIFGVGISGAISHLGAPGIADWWVYATTAANALAFLSLFAALWSSRPAPEV